MKICICGGGNLAHALVGYLGNSPDVLINIYSSYIQDWGEISVFNKGSVLCSGIVNIVTNDAFEAVSECDIIFFTVPSFVRSQILKKINPHLKKGVIIGSFPGAGGFNWDVERHVGKEKEAIVFSAQRVPYIARIIEKGVSVEATAKDRISVVVTNGFEKKVKRVLESLLNMKVITLNSFLEINLSNSNPILHTARLYVLFNSYKNGVDFYAKNNLFYEEWNVLSSKVLILMDEEFMHIIKALELKGVKSLKEHYEVSDEFEMTKKISSIEAFKDIKSPMISHENGFVPNLESRYFTEDIPYGLVLVKWFGQNLKIKTPYIDEVLNWVQFIKNEFIIENGYLVNIQSNQMKRLTNNYFNK